MSATFSSFNERAAAVSAEVHRFSSKSQALDFIREFMYSEGICEAPQRYAVWADDAFLSSDDKRRLAGEVPGLHFDVSRDRAAAAKIGISEMDWAIANTGTLVQDATAVEQRLVSTLPEIHVAIVRTERILADMPSVLKQLSPREAAYLSMITGPSRTADIERVLTIGVHGPGRLIIVCVDELEGVAK